MNGLRCDEELVVIVNDHSEEEDGGEGGSDGEEGLGLGGLAANPFGEGLDGPLGCLHFSFLRTLLSFRGWVGLRMRMKVQIADREGKDSRWVGFGIWTMWNTWEALVFLSCLVWFVLFGVGRGLDYWFERCTIDDAFVAKSLWQV